MFVIAIAACVAAVVAAAAVAFELARRRRRLRDERRPHPTVTSKSALSGGVNASSGAAAESIAAFLAELHAADSNRQGDAQTTPPAAPLTDGSPPSS